MNNFTEIAINYTNGVDRNIAQDRIFRSLMNGEEIKDADGRYWHMNGHELISSKTPRKEMPLDDICVVMKRKDVEDLANGWSDEDIPLGDIDPYEVAEAGVQHYCEKALGLKHK